MKSHAVFIAALAGLRVRAVQDMVELDGTPAQAAAALFGNYTLALLTDMEEVLADDLLDVFRSYQRPGECPGCEECR